LSPICAAGCPRFIADGGKKLLRPVAQRAPDEGIGLFLADFGPQRLHHRHQHLCLNAGLVQQRYFGIHHIVVEHAHRFILKYLPKLAAVRGPDIQGAVTRSR
jgi:hypothetical protein